MQEAHRTMSKHREFQGKRILIMGLGIHGGGVNTAQYFKTCGAMITITDLRNKNELRPAIAQLSHYHDITYVLGRHRKKDILASDIIIKNPGVPPDSPYLQFAQKNHIPITTDIGIFFRLFPGRIIAVTGTRGKSTTATLIALFLRTLKRPHIFLGGNIRTSVLEFLPQANEKDWAVLEMSSFQLHDLYTEYRNRPSDIIGKPAIAVITNIQRDHLNWHKTMTAYKKAKQAIFAFQQPPNLLVINPHDHVIRQMTRLARSTIVHGSMNQPLVSLVTKRLGAHYSASVALAVTVAEHSGVSPVQIKKTLERFEGLEGRQQHIATKNGIVFINDTTATTPDAAIAAVMRFQKKGTAHLILIAGGSDKALNFRLFVKTIRKDVDRLVLLPGNATQKIIPLLRRQRTSLPIAYASSMTEAVHVAYQNAKKGDLIMLSPGAASFELFLNEFDRGDQFVRAVSLLKTV